MRWKTPVEPKLDSRREIRSFAFLPTKTDDGHTVWLEYYSVIQQYKYVVFLDGFEDKAWVKIGKYSYK